MNNTCSLTRYPVFFCAFDTWQQSVARLLTAAGFLDNLPAGKPVLLKPNLVEALAPPVTTPAALIGAIIDYIQTHAPATEVIIGEGCGSHAYDTFHSFEKLGYLSMAQAKAVQLVDLNEAALVRKVDGTCRRWPEMYLPQIALDSFLVSVPVLKAHSLALVTLTLKNMMGLAPPRHYQQGGHWKKASFHDRIHEAIVDLNRYRTPDFTILDATIGMQEAHLWGPACSPPHNMLAAGYDPVAIDAWGAELLGVKWCKVQHIAMAHGKLGFADPCDSIQVVDHG
jgi:uncharacterized protein (DUF362 family)